MRMRPNALWSYCGPVESSGLEFDCKVRTLGLYPHACRIACAVPTGERAGLADVLVELASIERPTENGDRFAAEVPDGIGLAARRRNWIRHTRQGCGAE